MTAEPQNEESRPDRLRRLARIFSSAQIFFVNPRAFARRGIFTEPEVDRTFLKFAGAGENHGAYVGAYVIMPNHLHFFVALEPDKQLSVWMKSLKNSLSKTLRGLGAESPHWQKGFFDHVLRSDESCSQKWEYVR